jgi:hypothetical protein
MHLELAQTSAEVLQAHEVAKAARHLAKLVHAANETQAECVRMVVQAERRMVLEIEDGQARGEVAVREDNLLRGPEVPSADLGKVTYKDLGIDKRRVREWRILAGVPIDVLEEAVCLALLRRAHPQVRHRPLHHRFPRCRSQPFRSVYASDSRWPGRHGCVRWRCYRPMSFCRHGRSHGAAA